MRVGLTFFLRDTERSIWSNGADQQCVFLWMLLRRLPGVEVVAINGGNGDSARPPKGMMLPADIVFESISDSLCDSLDVLIEAGAQVSAEHVARVRARGGLAIAYRFGNSFVIDAERVIHGKPAGSIFNGAVFDEVWTNPQHMHSCASYWEVCYRAPVRPLPHLWDPYFIDRAVGEFSPGLSFRHKPHGPPYRVGIFEPNINIVKTCTIPMLICELVQRQVPALLGDVYVTNAIGIKDHLTFQKFAASLDVVKAGKMSFEGRYNTPWFMAKHADVMVSHQVENGLNFTYYEALYGGYPLVHNSELLKGRVGHYYYGFNAHDGARALIRAITEPAVSADAFLATLSSANPINVDIYDDALRRLTARAAAA